MPVTQPEYADYQWLVSKTGQHWLARCEAQSLPLPDLASKLRRELTFPQVQLLLTQVQLRQRAATRFGQSKSLLFTERALQQATDATLAAYKASRFVRGGPVVDLGCGVGGDLLAIAARGPTVGVDNDPILVLLAEANLRSLFRDAARVHLADVRELCILPEVAIHLDPDRRPGERRSVNLEFHQPGPELFGDLVRHRTGLALKLAPATDAATPLLRPAELEWIGHRRQCQQLVAWFGPLARFPERRVATVLDAASVPHHLVGDATLPVPPGSEIGRYVCEPAACVLAAGLASEFAHRHNLTAITAGGGYLTGDTPTDDAWSTWFEVREVMPFRLKRLKAWLQAHGIGRLEIKKRGVDVDPAQLSRQLRVAGDESMTLMVMSQGPRRRAVLARRVT